MNEGVSYPLIFSLSISKHSFQFFTVCHFRAMYQITPNVTRCLCTPMRVVFVKQHGHSLTAGVKIQPSSLLCAHDIPSSCFYTSVCLLKIYLILFDTGLAFLLVLIFPCSL